MSQNPFDPPAVDSARPPSSGRTNRFLLGGLLLCFLSCGGFCVYVEEPFEPHWTWEAPGPIKVLASADELWCFVEINRMVHRPGKLTSNPSHRIGYRQVVFVLDEKGIRERIVVSGDNGPSFHPNRGDIFRIGQDFFLFEGQSLNKAATLYEWQTDHFQRLSPDVVAARLKDLGIDNANNRLDVSELPNSEGWSRLLNIYGLHFESQPEEFSWRDSTFDVDFTTTEKLGTISIHCKNASNEWTDVFVTFDPRRKPS